MNKFEKELEKSKSHDRMFPNYYHEKILIKLFKDWQPPKPLVVVPRFIAEWLDNKSAYIIATSPIPKEVLMWSQENTGFRDVAVNLSNLIEIKVTGYTVEKEKKFSLVNKITGEYLVLPAIEYRIKNENIFDHSAHCKNDDLSEWKPEMYQFTEVEIASMETGSYEQIPVKVDEAEG